MKVCEVFSSIQGESSFVGYPCSFIRLAGCNLRCTYCDTPYALEGGEERTVDELVAEMTERAIPLVEITGGEPLLQEDVYLLTRRLLRHKLAVLVETNGSLPLNRLNRRVIKIVDMKCPGSGMSHRMNFSNLSCLGRKDEVKFVIGDREDYLWAKDVVKRCELEKRCQVLFSPVHPHMKAQDLAGWIVEDRLPVRFQLQLHKSIWPPDRRGV